MSRTVVTPAARYTGAHSTCVTWVCMSHSPGMMVLPSTGTGGTSPGIVTDARAPPVAHEHDAVRNRRPSGAVDDRRAGHRVGAALQQPGVAGDRLEVGEAI